MTGQNQSVSSLTVAELDTLISDIVRRIVREELYPLAAQQREALPTALLETFGSWEDSRTPEEIVSNIYESRSISNSDLKL